MARVSLDEFLKLQEQCKKVYLIMVEELKKNSVKFKSLEANIFPDIKTTGIKGDQRVYAYPIFIAIDMPNGKRFYEPNILEKISTRITNECENITRVVYRLTH